MFAIVPLTAVFDFIYSVVTLGWLVSIVYTVQYMFYLFKILNTLEMVSHICQIKYRLKYIGDLLKYYHYYYDYMTEVHQHLSYRKHFFINKGNELNQIPRCYLLITPGMRKVVTELKEIIQTKPIYFHVLKFYKLEYGIILSIASSVVTYTVIFLQSVS
ncbi:uncharacterized protein LOC133320299 [Danaus plexippus]|uniref:uncharacterized protein LOC133320299 n=1 Tax=Danaus plexippus TaxID=13037 RepID=UPI002AB2C850|nr:uncharacterized protein LOC133320299 [Danaus plexippus]